MLELCTMLTTIDVINFPDFKISCFEFVNGYTFEESIVSNTPQPELQEPYVPPVEEGEDEYHGGNNEVGPKENTPPESADSVDEKEVQDIESVDRESAPTNTTPIVTGTHPTDVEKQMSEVNHDMMNQILLGEWNRFVVPMGISGSNIIRLSLLSQ